MWLKRVLKSFYATVMLSDVGANEASRDRRKVYSKSTVNVFSLAEHCEVALYDGWDVEKVE
jgi:hypothetical protein